MSDKSFEQSFIKVMIKLYSYIVASENSVIEYGLVEFEIIQPIRVPPK